MTTTDPFTAAAWLHWATGQGIERPNRDANLERLAFVGGWEAARSHLAAQEPQVTIRREEGKPATCEVRQDGVLIFSGRDHSADLRVAAQEPTDAEVEAALDTFPGPWRDTSAEEWWRAQMRDALSAARRARGGTT